MALKLGGLTAFKAGLADAIDAGAKHGADLIADLAQQLAPEDEGTLKDSKQVRPGDEPGTYIVSFGGPGTGAEDYATIVEYGDPSNPNYPAQPYLGPAKKAINVKAEIQKQIRALAARSTA